jgi:hypothetical protein
LIKRTAGTNTINATNSNMAEVSSIFAFVLVAVMVDSEVIACQVEEAAGVGLTGVGRTSK